MVDDGIHTSLFEQKNAGRFGSTVIQALLDTCTDEDDFTSVNLLLSVFNQVDDQAKKLVSEAKNFCTKTWQVEYLVKYWTGEINERELTEAFRGSHSKRAGNVDP